MVTKYIIMCGGNYSHWERPRHLSVVNGEELVARTIRLLRKNGITDISISTHNPIFEKFNVPILKHDNLYNCKWHNIEEGYWFNCFYPTNEPTCYILGDVYFSEEAIKTIVNTDTKDIDMFGSIPPFAENYIKNHIEAFAIKVVNQEHLREAINKAIELDKQGKFWRKPIIWELWTVIQNNPLQTKSDEYIYDYTKINDYTCDIDWKEDIIKLEKILGGNMIKLQATEEFTLSRFNEVKNIVRKNENKNEAGHIYKEDIFECENNLADYLCGNNPLNRPVVNVLEVEKAPLEEKVVEINEEKKPIREIKKRGRKSKR